MAVKWNGMALPWLRRAIGVCRVVSFIYLCSDIGRVGTRSLVHTRRARTQRVALSVRLFLGGAAPVEIVAFSSPLIFHGISALSFHQRRQSVAGCPTSDALTAANSNDGSSNGLVHLIYGPL